MEIILQWYSFFTTCAIVILMVSLAKSRANNKFLSNHVSNLTDELEGIKK